MQGEGGEGTPRRGLTETGLAASLSGTSLSRAETFLASQSLVGDATALGRSGGASGESLEVFVPAATLAEVSDMDQGLLEGRRSSGHQVGESLKD